MNKKLKFDPDLESIILSGEKSCTWRLWDDKDLRVGDKVTFLVKADLHDFAEVELTEVTEKKMGDITPDDEANIGHEPYEDNYVAYTQLYGKKVTPDTPVKVIRYKVLRIL